MARFAPVTLRRYLLGGQLPPGGCLQRSQTGRQAAQSLCPRSPHAVRSLHTAHESADAPATTPYRKQLKDAAKKKRVDGGAKKHKVDNQKLEEWELTVGIEIHAQLNTARKLFSPAASTFNDTPNSHVALFDVAMPGSQPIFQKETLIPALRAALALNCDIQKTSKFDRKHYFHWDQPSGYQITQYYEPFAKNGYITLYAHDGIAKEDGEEIKIGIKQIQMEQDTAKTVSQPGELHLLDFNRVGLPLIEIITLPQIHYPSTAAAFVRKVQILLDAVDACVLGMQSGGLRADVNVSVRKRGSEEAHEYAGVKGLGQRTEIKNLSSFKAVEDAIIAERDRQIGVLESGGKIEGETRGWTIGTPGTRRLRGKEGEVDYRYMPDPDISPVVVGDDLVDHLRRSLGILPDQDLQSLVETYGLTMKDAMSLVSQDDGGRAEYFINTVEEMLRLSPGEELKVIGRLCGNWVLHEMGGLKYDASEEDATSPLSISPEGQSAVIRHEDLAALIHYLHTNKITGKTAKKILALLFEYGLAGENMETAAIIEAEQLWFTPLSEEEYEVMAQDVMDERVVQEILAGKKQKVKFLLGQMMRNDRDGKVDPQRATKVLERLIEEYRVEKGL